MYYLKFEQESIAITKSTNPHESIFINYNSLQIVKITAYRPNNISKLSNHLTLNFRRF